MRAVSGGQARSFDSLIINPEGKTFSDPQTGLMWEMKNNKDGKADYNNLNDADNNYNWQGALNLVAQLNDEKYGTYSDWRLPTIKELSSIVDLSRIFPAIPALLENTTHSSYYWSSTTHANRTYGAWYMDMDFRIGRASYDYKSDSYYVRAVRGGQ